ncbi:DEAD/DEAH box helicase family protein, partial [Candidatus Peregrinibacteria bacterium]|nr:DEAD/DEAH box helicase family protein [Candidatus Peregrinibacteria bacterium]
MELKQYQQQAVNELANESLKRLKKTSPQKVVFKAPTGSGKTVMMAFYLQSLLDATSEEFAFVWLSVHDLHNQSKKSLENILREGAFTFSNLPDISDLCIKQNEIIFINWESITKKAGKDSIEKDIKKGDYINVFMADNEYDRNLGTFVENTQNQDRTIILIIDESHLYSLSEDSVKIINNIIQPKLTIEVSATPHDNPTVEVELPDVIDEGMIKKEVVINPKLADLQVSNKSTDEVIISASMKQYEELSHAYKNEVMVSYAEIDIKGENKLIPKDNVIRPLMLIQLPSEAKGTSDIDKKKIDEIRDFLTQEYDITISNGKLAIWLSEEKENLEGIENINSRVEVLIFKQAIAVGWDCPRAQILLMFRETKSITFEIQTVGRIMRMPEHKHYANELLNKAYIYTNLENIEIAEGIAKSYIKRKESKRSPLYEDINLQSIYYPRLS